LTHSLFRWALAGTAAAMASAVLAAPALAADDSVLLAGAPQRISAAVGDDFAITLSVTNTGATALNGAGVMLYTGWAFERTEQFANCYYSEDVSTFCSFDQTLEPGKSYRVVLPYRLRADTLAPGSQNSQFGWLTAAELPDQEGRTAGTGDTLLLQEGTKLGESTSGSNQSVDVAVTGTNGVDLVATGDAVSGAAGDQVQAVVGVHNAGPAALEGNRFGTSAAEVEVTLPTGTSFVSAPDECGRGEDAVHYVCAAPRLFKAGATAAWPFTLKINKVVADAAGTVEVNPVCQCVATDDRDISNDTALLVANPSAGNDTDLIKPVIASTGLLDGQRAPVDLVFDPAAADNVGVTALTATVNGSLQADCTLTSGCEVSLAGLPSDKEATVTVRATDAAGNYAEKSVKVLVDNVVPTAAFSPAAGSSVAGGPVTITLTGVPGDVWRVDAIDGGIETQLPEAPWTYTWNAISGTTSPRFVLHDFAGNIATLATDYVVAARVPVITRVDFAGAYSTNRLDTGTGWVGGVSTLKPTFQDGPAVTRVEWSVDGVVKSTSQNFTWDARTGTAATATVRLQVWDAAGNTSSKSFLANIDRTAPTTTIAPGQKALIRGTSYVTSIRAADTHGVAVTNLAGRSGSVTSVRLSSGKDGAKAITWVAVDKLGNSVTATRTVIVDNTAPALKVTKAPKNKSKLTTKVAVTVSASDRNGVAKVQLLVNGKVVATDAKAGYSFVLNPKKYGKTFTVQLRAYDKAGNARSSAKLTYRR
jgi:hypothetical protein